MKQITRIATLCATVLCAGQLGAGNVTHARDLVIVDWGGTTQIAQRDVYYRPFLESTGTKQIEETWNGGIGTLRTKVKGGEPNWDVVQVEVDDLVVGCEEGLFEKIDWAKLGGKDKFIESAVHDCGVGSITWAMSFGYDTERLRDGPKNWVDFWDTIKFPGKRGMRKGAKYALESALMADGVAPNNVYKILASPAGVDRAFRKLDQLKPHIIWWSSISQVPDMLASGEVIMSVVTPGRLLVANRRENKKFKLVWEGNMASVDYWVILKGSPNKDKAMDFIAFATRPENQRKLPPLVPLGVTNKEAIAQIDPSVAADLPTFPANRRIQLAVDPVFWLENADQLNQRYNSWAAK